MVSVKSANWLVALLLVVALGVAACNRPLERVESPDVATSTAVTGDAAETSGDASPRGDAEGEASTDTDAAAETDTGEADPAASGDTQAAEGADSAAEGEADTTAGAESDANAAGEGDAQAEGDTDTTEGDAGQAGADPPAEGQTDADAGDADGTTEGDAAGESDADTTAEGDTGQADADTPAGGQTDADAGDADSTTEGDAAGESDAEATAEGDATQAGADTPAEGQTDVAGAEGEADTQAEGDADQGAADSADAATSADSAEAAGGENVIPHTVAPGENLYRIGLRYGISWLRLAELNNLDNPNRLIVGQTILVPSSDVPSPPATATPSPGDETIYIVRPGDTLFTIGLAFGISWPQIAEANGLVNPNQIFTGQELKIPVAAPGPSQPFLHTVAPGETLFTVSVLYGVNWQAIAAANNIRSPYVIFPGQTLAIPGE